MQRALLFSLVAASYLLLAGGPAWTLAPLSALAGLGVLVEPRRTLAFPAATRALDFALIAVAVAIFVQLIPLPTPVASLLSPQAHQLTDRLHFTVGAAPQSWRPLSLDARATTAALVTFLLAMTSFWIARATFSAGGQTRQFFRAFGMLAALAAAVAMVQKGLTPHLHMGLFVPDARNANPLGPFLNRNHFAGWLLLASAATVGYLVAHLHIHPAYRQGPRAAMKRFVVSGALLSGVSAIFMIGTLLMTLSRSAAAGLGVGALVGGWLGRPRLRIERTHLPAALGAVGVGLLLLVAFIDIEGWFTRLQHTLGIAGEGFDRITIWRESLPMIRDFPLTGTGAGTYGRAMGHYQETRLWIGSMQQWAYFNTAHSHYVQLAVEGGLLLMIPVITALVLLVRLGLRAIRADKGEVFWMRVGAAAGLVGIAVQSIWEVALVMPANGVLAGVLAGLLLHHRAPGRSQPDRPWAPDVQASRAR